MKRNAQFLIMGLLIGMSLCAMEKEQDKNTPQEEKISAKILRARLQEIKRLEIHGSSSPDAPLPALSKEDEKNLKIYEAQLKREQRKSTSKKCIVL
jgi:hypothetical protein